MSTIWILKGTSCSGKSYWSNIIQSYNNTVCLSADIIAETQFNIRNGNNPKKVFNEMALQAEHLILSDKNIIIDATNLSFKKDLFWDNIFQKYSNIKKVCIYFDLEEESLFENIKKRKEEKWEHLSFPEIIQIIEQQKKALTYPTIKFDRIITINKNLSRLEIFNQIKDFL